MIERPSLPSALPSPATSGTRNGPPPKPSLPPATRNPVDPDRRAWPDVFYGTRFWLAAGWLLSAAIWVASAIKFSSAEYLVTAALCVYIAGLKVGRP